MRSHHHRHFLTLLLTLLPSLPLTTSLHASEAGVIDWHKQLIGVPLSSSSSIPAFVSPPVIDPYASGGGSTSGLVGDVMRNVGLAQGGDGNGGGNLREVTRDLVVSASDVGVVAGVDARTGEVAWRFIHDTSDPIIKIQIDTSNNLLTTLSGPSGSTLRTLSLSTGTLLLETRLHDPTTARLLEPPALGVDIAFIGAGLGAGGEEEGEKERVVIESYIDAGVLEGMGEKGEEKAKSAEKEAVKEKEKEESGTEAFVLANGRDVYRIDVLTGAIKWKWNPAESPDTVTFTSLHPTRNALYALGIATYPGPPSSAPTYVIQVVSISLRTGETIAHAAVPSQISSPASYLVLSAPTHSSNSSSSGSGSGSSSGSLQAKLKEALKAASAASSSSSSSTSPSARTRLVWLDATESTLKSLPLSPRLDGKGAAIKGEEFVSFEDIGLARPGATLANAATSEAKTSLVTPKFLAKRADGAVRVLGLDEQGGITGDFILGDTIGNDQKVQSIFASYVDAQSGKTYIARTFWSQTYRQAVVHVLSEDGKTVVANFRIPFKTQDHGVISDFSFTVSSTETTGKSVSVLITTSTGALQLWEYHSAVLDSQGPVAKQLWTREESLTDIRVASFVELPERLTELTAGGGVGDADEGFVERVRRQITDARSFPTYLVHFIKRFVTGSYDSVSTSIPGVVEDSTIAANVSALYRDSFGIRKVIVTATTRGIVFGLDSSNGAILWRRLLGLGWAQEVGGRHVPVKMFVVKTVQDGERPQVVLITQRLASNGLVDTVLFHIDALTGEDILSDNNSPRTGSVIQGLDIIESELVDAFMLSNSGGVIALIDKFLQVHLYPDTSTAKSHFSTIAPKLYFPLRANGRVLGHQIHPEVERTGKFTAYSTWTTHFPPGEDIISLSTRPLDEPVASLGKVLGDRTTLYKFLSPHTSVVVTRSSRVNAKTCGVYVFDGAKGSLLYHAIVPANEGSCEVITSLTENWLVYLYYDSEATGVNEAKGYRAVSVEFYEGSGVNDRTRSSDASIYSNRTSDVHYYEQSFVFPSAITALTTTSTKFGITTKDLIVSTINGQVRSFPRRMFDPRRPKHKPTAQEMEEWLVQYDPLIPDDSRSVVSHNYNVAKIKNIITSPAILESTSLIFAYGVDLFSTRVAPSKTFDVLSESFNKAQLVLTVSALGIAIMVTRPMVARKKLREKWYHS